MKLMDKIKNLFLDEEEYELEEEEFPQYNEKGKENKESKKSSKDELPKVMRETIKKEEKVELKVKPEEFIKKEPPIEENKEQNKRFNFPIDFNEDFPSRTSNKPNFDNVVDKVKVNNRTNNVNVLKIDKQVTQKVTDLYTHREEEKVKPKFKASPVISPVYGVLDKNYKKEEVREKSDESSLMKRPSKKVDFETVRKKAFGNLTYEIKDSMLCENCELYKEVKRISSLKEDDLLYDMTVDETRSVTIEKAYDDYEEFGVVYEPKLEKESVNEEEKEVNIEEELNKAIIDDNNIEEHENNLLADIASDDISNDNSSITDILKKEIPSREEKKKEKKVDEDFFELIDSMYKERVDE